MPNWTLGEIMSTATRRAGRRADFPASVVSQIANTAIQWVADHENHASLESSHWTSLSSGATSCPLPTGCAELLTATLVWSWSTASSAVSSRATLTRLSPTDADKRGPDPAGTPNAFLPYAGRVEFFPSLNSAYSALFRFRAQPSDLTDTSAVPSLSTPWRYAALLKTEQLLREDVGDHAGAAMAEGRYQSYAGSVRNEDARRQRSFPIGLAPVWPRGRTG